MKGTIVGAWISTSQKLWGEDLTLNAMTKVGIAADKIFYRRKKFRIISPRR